LIDLQENWSIDAIIDGVMKEVNSFGDDNLWKTKRKLLNQHFVQEYFILNVRKEHLGICLILKQSCFQRDKNL